MMSQRVCLTGCLILLIASLAQAEDPKMPEVLTAGVGSWEGKVEYWNQGKGRPPLLGEAKEHTRLLGDRWLVSEFALEVGGFHVQGVSHFGYNPEQEKLVGAMVDTTSSRQSVYVGVFRPRDATFQLETRAESSDPAQVPRRRMDVQHRAADEKIVTIFVESKPGMGDFVKYLSIRYFRAPTTELK